jgi:hypothetical protein
LFIQSLFPKLLMKHSDAKLCDHLEKIRRPVGFSVNVASCTGRVVASPIDDTRNSINEVVSFHTTINELFKLGNVVPSPNIVTLQ